MYLAMRLVLKLLKYTSLLIIVILILLPYGLKHGAIYYLETEKQIEANISDVRFNVLTGQVGVSGVHLYGEKGGELHLDELLIDVSWLELLSKRAVIEQIRFKNFRSNITEQSGGWNVGGLFFPLSPSSDEKAVASTPSSEPVTWAYGVREIDISNINLIIESQYTDSHIALDKLTVENAYSWEPNNATQFDLRLLLNSDALQIKGEAKPFVSHPEVSANVVFDDVRLAPFLKSVKMLPIRDVDATLFSQLQLSAIVKPNDIQLTIDGAYGLKNINLKDDMRDYQLSKIQVKGKYTVHVKDDVEISAVVALAVDKLKIQSLDKKINIVSFESWTADGINVKALDEVDVAQINLHKLEMLDELNVSQPASLTLEDIVVDTLRYQPDAVHIDRISLEKLQGEVMLNERGELSVLMAVMPPNPQTEEASIESPQLTNDQASKNKAGEIPESVPETNDSKPFSFTLNEFFINSDSQFHFVDRSVTPMFDTKIHDIKLSVNNINVLDVNEKMHIDMKLKIDEYAEFVMKGDVLPFAEKANATLTANLSALELVPLSSYAGKFAGLNIQRGTLDFDANIRVTNDELDVENTFYLRQLMMESDDSEVSQGLFKDMPMPLNLTLDVLRDKQNVIKLDIPVKGDVNNPDFSLQDVYNHAMKKALKFAATHYLMQAVQPLGLAITAGKLLGKAMVPKFDPLIFEPGSTQISHVNAGHIEKLAKVLQEKTKLRFTLCGTATESDWKVLQAQALEGEAGVALKKEDRTKWLLKMANDRAKQIKKQFVEQYELSPNRLLSCNGKINKDKEDSPAMPAVDVSL